MSEAMDYAPSELKFRTLREANQARMPQFKNPHGETKHSGGDWSLNDWMTGLTGEVGETANLLKKVRRQDFTLEQVRDELSDELADIAIYLDLLAWQAGIDLGAAVVRKFNAKSKDIGAPVFIDEIERTRHPVDFD